MKKSIKIVILSVLLLTVTSFSIVMRSHSASARNVTAAPTPATELNADYVANQTTGKLPLTVEFTDLSTGEITYRQWDFGDGTGGFKQKTRVDTITHTYTTSGNFTTSLTVSGTNGTDTETKPDYILVSGEGSTIKLTVSSPVITFGESINLGGQIIPAHEAEVTLHFTNNSGDRDTETVTSNTNGAFILEDYFSVEGGVWNIVAGWEGDDDHDGAESDPEILTVNQAETALTISVFSSAIEIGQTVDIGGIVKLTPDNETTRSKFIEDEKIKLIRIDPDSEYEDVIETQPFISDGYVQYKFEKVKLPAIGTWKLLSIFDEDDSFNGTSSATIEIEVSPVFKELSGYAILVEGRAEGDSGTDSYNLTSNYIFGKLKERGFAEENIYYFNFEATQSGVDERPSKSSVLNAISTWAADKMNTYPAPLYIIFVGPGDKEKYFIYPDAIKPDDLADATDNLESQLNSGASGENIITILGANHSGSFMDNLVSSGASATGANNRIVIASADTEEVAYKGPLPPDKTIRHGDYLTWELFKYAAMGFNLRKSFEMAANKVAEFTKNKNGNGLNGASAGNGQYADESAQHPLLDDNGDGIGTFGELSSISGRDGEISTNLILGVGMVTAQLELTDVTGITTLEANDPPPTLFAVVNDTALVDTVWIEIVSPGHALKNNNDATEQQVVDLPRFSYSYFDAAEEKYVWNNFSDNKDFNNFGTAGEYEIFYYARGKNGAITPFMESNLFKNAENNQPPPSFTFISPADGTDTAVALVFDWEDSKKESDAAVTYTFQISENTRFDPVYYQQRGLTESFTVVDKSASLQDGTAYYWRVIASDEEGGVTYIGTSLVSSAGISACCKTTGSNAENSETASSSFTPKLANGTNGFIRGIVFEKEKGLESSVSGATVTIEGVEGAETTTEEGAYLFQLPTGTYNISAKATGYALKTVSAQVDSLNDSVENIGLTSSGQSAIISGKVTDKKTKDRLEGVLITVEKDTITETATSGSDGKYSISDMEPGKYKLKAEKTGYKTYEDKVKLKAGKEKKLNIKMKQEK